jgi:hypothetical protein
MKVRKGKRKGEKCLTYEDIKELIIHLISMAFLLYIMYIFIYVI